MAETKEIINCHLSIDDTYQAFKELCDDKYVSIWQHPFWQNLRKAHEKWGCSFTLYVFGGLEKQTDLLKKTLMIKELRTCKSWMKVAYHGTDSYELTEFKESFCKTNQFFSKLVGEDISARIIRLHRFQGTCDIVDYLKNEDVKCLLAADDNRKSYDLCEEQVQELQSKGIVRYNSMIYLHTDIRLERRHFLAQYYNWKNRGTKLCVLFTHECHIKKKNSLVMLKLNLLLKLMNRSFNINYICR